MNKIAKIDSRQNLPAAQDLDATFKLAQTLIESKMLPDAIKTPQQAFMIILKGRELGVPPVYALTHINVIQGKPAASPEMMLALIRSKVPGSTIKFTKLGRDGCEIQAKRPEEKDLTTISFDAEDAKLAGLLGKDNWRKYPRAMFRSRAIAEMARTLFPDAISGVSYTPEELGAEVKIADDGSTIDIDHEESPETYSKANATHRGRAVDVGKKLGLTQRADFLWLCDALDGTELAAIEEKAAELIVQREAAVEEPKP